MRHTPLMLIVSSVCLNSVIMSKTEECERTGKMACLRSLLHSHTCKHTHTFVLRSLQGPFSDIITLSIICLNVKLTLISPTKINPFGSFRFLNKQLQFY